MRVVKPTRVTRTYTQKLVAAPSKIIALLCPVRETEWYEGWNPHTIYSNSGVAESDCVFISKENDMSSIWYTVRREPDNGFIELIEIIPNVTACKLSIQINSVKNGAEAKLTYIYTSLGQEGDVYITSFTEKYFEQLMKDWEVRINHYLSFGSKKIP